MIRAPHEPVVSGFDKLLLALAILATLLLLAPYLGVSFRSGDNEEQEDIRVNQSDVEDSKPNVPPVTTPASFGRDEILDLLNSPNHASSR